MTKAASAKRSVHVHRQLVHNRFSFPLTQLTLNWSLSNASSHITPDYIYPYLSFGACTLLILMALSGAVISIM